MTVWVEPAAPPVLSVSVRFALYVVEAAAGVKITDTVHDAPVAMDVPQLLVWLKSLGLAPAMAMLVSVRAALPVFETVTGRAADGLPAGVLGKASDVGDSDTAGSGHSRSLSQRD